MTRWSYLIGFGLLFALLFSGCASFIELKGKDYPASAKLNYEAGLKALGDENYEVAGNYFQLVKNKYSYSKYATVSELLISETYYRRDMFSEAITSFLIFIRNHPTHPCVPFAQFKIGESYFEQMPEDWWFMPPTHERDQKLTQDAMVSYERLINLEKARDYHFSSKFKPIKISTCDSRNYDQIRSMLYLSKKRVKTCMQRLIAREVYVAKFYLDKDKPMGAVMRLEAAVDEYPMVAEDLEFISLLAESYKQAHMYKRARATWRWVAQAHPTSTEASELDENLADLDEAEQDYIEDQKRRAEKRVPKEERWKKIREENNLQDLQPDPDPNDNDRIPLPDPQKMRRQF